MIRLILGIVSFISLYITILWLQFYSLESSPRKKQHNLPYVTIAAPAYNESKTILTTLTSLIELAYPRKKLEILVVDDGSIDTTSLLVKEFIRKHPYHNIHLLQQPNKGKAAALNFALRNAHGSYFACVDADSTVAPDALEHLLSCFSHPNIGAAISIIKVKNQNTIYSKMQRIEYAISAFTRKLMANIGTLAITPGVLSVYSTSVLKKTGGFAEGNMTEDFEIALRLKHHGYHIVYEPRSITYTNVPSTFSSLKRQRIRWFRGFISNHLQYKDMLFNKKYHAFGYFQMPLNILGVLILIITTSIFFATSLQQLYEFSIRSYLIPDYFFGHVLAFPSFSEFFLGQDIQIMLPIIIASMLGFYFLYLAHKEVKEKLIKFPIAIWMYLVVFPYITLFHWLHAITHEILRLKKRW